MLKKRYVTSTDQFTYIILHTNEVEVKVQFLIML